MKNEQQRHDISDAVWSLLEPHLPGQRGQWGGIARITGALSMRVLDFTHRSTVAGFTAVLREMGYRVSAVPQMA